MGAVRTSDSDVAARGEDTNRWILHGVFVLLVLVAISRSPYILVHGRFWAEEGRIHFGHMLSDDSPRSLFFVYGHSGYFDVFTNAGTWLGAQVPIARAPL